LQRSILHEHDVPGRLIRTLEIVLTRGATIYTRR